MNAAIVGTGLVAGYHARALKDQGVSIVAVVGSGPDKAKEFADRWDIPRSGADYTMALADDIRAVHICTPPVLHYQMVRDALLANKHVICEKPLTFNPEESSDLAQLAHASGLVNAVGFNIRFHPACIKARDLITDGDLGKIRFVHGSYLQEFHLLPCPYGWRYDSRLAGPMRAVTEIGSHWIDIAEFFIGSQVQKIAAQFGNFNPRRWSTNNTMIAEPTTGAKELVIDSEDVAFLMLQFKDGTIGNVALSEVSHGRINYCSVDVSGDKGTLWWNSEDAHRINIGRLGQGVYSQINPWADAFQDTFRSMFAAIYADIKAGGPSVNPAYPTFVDGHRNVSVCQAAFTSANEQSRWVEVKI